MKDQKGRRVFKVKLYFVEYVANSVDADTGWQQQGRTSGRKP